MQEVTSDRSGHASAPILTLAKPYTDIQTSRSFFRFKGKGESKFALLSAPNSARNDDVEILSRDDLMCEDRIFGTLGDENYNTLDPLEPLKTKSKGKSALPLPDHFRGSRVM